MDFESIVEHVRAFHEENVQSGGKTKTYVKTMDCCLDGGGDEATFVDLFEPYCDLYAIESVVPNVQGIDYTAWLKNGTPHYNALGVKLPPISVCPQPFHLITICPDGRVVPCSNEAMIGIGDCRRQALADIWRGDPLRQCQRKMLDGNLAFGGVCATCSIVQCRPFPEDLLDHDVQRLKQLYDSSGRA